MISGIWNKLRICIFINLKCISLFFVTIIYVCRLFNKIYLFSLDVCENVFSCIYMNRFICLNWFF